MKIFRISNTDSHFALFLSGVLLKKQGCYFLIVDDNFSPVLFTCEINLNSFSDMLGVATQQIP